MWRKLILSTTSLLLSIVLLLGITVFALPATSSTTRILVNSEGEFALQTDGYTLSVDKATLNLSITKGSLTWYSGKRADEDGLESTVWQNRVVDGVTVGYYSKSNNTPSVRSISSLRPSVEFTEKTDGFSALIYLDTLKLTFKINVSLQNGALKVQVPYSSIIEESETYSFAYLILYPFFNSSFGQTDGSILIPDGSGATIDLSQKTSAAKPYTARIYGSDIGVSATKLTSTSEYTAQLPMYAVYYSGGAGVLSVVSSGDEYSEINAYVSGIDTGYNYAYAKFIYRELYVKYYSASGSAGKSSVAIQEDKNQFDAEQTFYLCEDAGLGSLAQIYRDYLSQNALMPNQTVEAATRIQFLMAENKDSLLGKEVLNMTTTDFVSNVMDTLSVDNLAISLLGYTNGGLTGSYPKVLPFEGGTGGKSGYKDLIQKAVEKGIKLTFAVDYVKAAESESRANKARTISDQYAVIGDVNVKSFSDQTEYNVVTYARLKKLFEKYDEKFSDLSAYGLDLYTLGRYLYSSYNGEEVFSRSQYVDALVELLSNGGLSYDIDSPNQYLFGVMSAYLQTPTSSSGFIIETQSVPFLQMVLSGGVAMYSQALNLDYMGIDDMLELIEYNVYPAFLLTEKDAIELYGTASSYIFTSAYDIWKDKVEEIDQTVCGILKEVANATYLSHVQLTAGVYECKYSNGKTIVVNYNETAYLYGSVSIEGKTAKVIND